MTIPTSPLVNALSEEKSLYLKQHANNPVAWQVWNEETQQHARSIDRPLFVSIGYAACHWCHVMERETFENPKIAEFLNDHFIPIKIDREEQPNIDGLYMRAAECMGVQGGWPLSIFAHPNGEPFYIGTYFPPERKGQLPGFLELVTAIDRLWQDERHELEHRAKTVSTTLQKHFRKHHSEPNRAAARDVASENPSADLSSVEPRVADPHPTRPLFSNDKTFADLHLQYFDSVYGGFRFHPQNKFPPSMALRLLMTIGVRERRTPLLDMCEQTLTAMHNGGLYDHIGGGIARYSTDPEWHVPHFEKMLYDNALFIETLLDAYLLTHRSVYLIWAEETANYLMEHLFHDDKAFMSSQDADSDGEEGLYYIWTVEELQKLLTAAEWTLLQNIFDLSPEGNFEGKNILFARAPLVRFEETILSKKQARDLFDHARQKLYAARVKRNAPLTDDKILTAWNGLAISACARLARILHASDLPKNDLPKSNSSKPKAKANGKSKKSSEYILEYACSALHLVRTNLFDRGNERLFRRYAGGEAGHDGTLSDYAAMAVACLDLYATTFDETLLDFARDLVRCAIKFFSENIQIDSDEGSSEDSSHTRKTRLVFYDQDERSPVLIARYSDTHDGVEPAGLSKLAEALCRLAAYRLQSTDNDSAGDSAAANKEMSQSSATYSPVDLSDHGSNNGSDNGSNNGSNNGSDNKWIDETMYEMMAQGIFAQCAHPLEQGMLPYMQRIHHEYCLGYETLTFHGSDKNILPFVEVVARQYTPRLQLLRGKRSGPAQVIQCKGQTCLAPLRDVATFEKRLNEDNNRL